MVVFIGKLRRRKDGEGRKAWIGKGDGRFGDRRDIGSV